MYVSLYWTNNKGNKLSQASYITNLLLFEGILKEIMLKVPASLHLYELYLFIHLYIQHLCIEYIQSIPAYRDSGISAEEINV